MASQPGALVLIRNSYSKDEKARGKHVGTALYEYVRDYAKSIGCNNITLNVWEGNDPALSFYRNMGMKVQKTTMEIVPPQLRDKGCRSLDCTVPMQGAYKTREQR